VPVVVWPASTTPTTTTTTTTVPSLTEVSVPDGSVTDPAVVQPGKKFRLRAKCKNSETVTVTFQGSKQTVTCDSTLVSGLGRPSASVYNGVAEVELTAPSTPGTYDIVVELGTSLERYVLSITVAGESTTSEPLNDVLPATGGSNRAGSVAMVFLVLGVLATWLGRRPAAS
jgi:hypothetical protein